MSRLAIIHFQPLELYPPVQNLLQFLESKPEGFKLVVYSNSGDNQLRLFSSGLSKIRIVRIGKTYNGMKALNRYYNYLLFNIRCLFSLIRLKPDKVFYYETISSFPAFLYKRFFNSKAEVLIHYHEYTSPTEYKSGMKLVTFFHGFEKWLYPKAGWVSHTNEYRMQHFISDLKPFEIANPHILSNYPSKSWYAKPKEGIEFPVKIVYVGAFSLDTMFAKEFAECVNQQNGKIIWDIYSLNMTQEATNYFTAFASSYINIKPGVNYHELPSLLKGYDVGVILYNGHIPNYVYNAPNKLFEYMACGLDVWFPDVMTGCMQYITKNSFPKVLAIDFTQMQNFNIEKEISREGCSIKQYVLFYESGLEEIAKELLIGATFSAQILL